MGLVPDWNRQSFKKSAPLEKPVVRKFSEGGSVTQDTRESVAGASYDSIGDFMNYVKGRGKYDVRAMDNPYTESAPALSASEPAREDPDPVPMPQQKEPVNTAAPEDGNVGGPRQESAPAAGSARRAARAVVVRKAPQSAAPARPAVQPKQTTAQPPAASVEPARPVSEPMATPSQSVPSTAMAVSAASPYGRSVGDRIRDSRSDKPLVAQVLDKLASPRPYVGVYKDGGLVGDSHWTRANYKKPGC